MTLVYNTVHVNCQWDSDGEEEESESDASWMTDGSEWETDTEDEVEQDEGLCTPAEKTTLTGLTPSISPEDATAAKQTAEKRKLFVKGN